MNSSALYLKLLKTGNDNKKYVLAILMDMSKALTAYRMTSFS
jgi:hypothetical protein